MTHDDHSTATARSRDGRSFLVETPAESILTAGAFVTLTLPGGEVQLGQLDDLAAHGRSGTGTILGTIGDDGALTGTGTAFASAEVAVAGSEQIRRIAVAARATLPLGSLRDASDVPALLSAHRFNRHTFWCGQSGSGKTYALGVLLEQLLINTRLPILVFDPNSDFVRLPELRDETASHPDAAVLGERDIRVLRPHPRSGETPLRVRFTELSMSSKAAVLQLDPIADHAEYNVLLHLEATVGSRNPDAIVPRLLQDENPSARALADRIENLRLIHWDVWAGERAPVTDAVNERPDATVLDLGGFAVPGENLVVALAVLDELWERREERRPLLIVIDEAHNLCSPDNDGPLERAVRERLIQIAAEGRKFGLWLLLSTQRPSKIHRNIISQCDNLVLMRMSSPSDLDELAGTFGYAPEPLLRQSPRFRQGEALFAGGFIPAPALVRIGTRLTPEGGTDVPVPLL